MFEDIQILRPFSLSGTPEMWNKVYNEFQRVLSVALIEARSVLPDVVSPFYFSTSTSLHRVWMMDM